MNFTILRRTPEGVQVCMLVMLEEQRNTDGKGKGRQERERRLEKGELEQDMIRLSLVYKFIPHSFPHPSIKFHQISE